MQIHVRDQIDQSSWPRSRVLDPNQGSYTLCEFVFQKGRSRRGGETAGKEGAEGGAQGGESRGRKGVIARDDAVVERLERPEENWRVRRAEEEIETAAHDGGWFAGSTDSGAEG